MPNWEKIVERWLQTGNVDTTIPGDRLLAVLTSKFGVGYKGTRGSHAQVRRIVRGQEFNSTIVLTRELSRGEAKTVLKQLGLV